MWDLICSQVSMTTLTQIYRAVDAFVLPSHGEGWGLTLMEAMAMALPTIGTRWSGNMAFMTGVLFACAI